MATDDFRDAALILLGHGSTVNDQSSAPTYQHAAELRRRGLFGQVLEGFWKVEPAISGVLRGVLTPRIFVVPLFISEGYFTEEIIPCELGLCGQGQQPFPRVQQRGSQRLHYCRPVGTHARMTDLLLGRAREVVENHPFPRAPRPQETSLFIAGHGTGNNENSRRAIERQVDRIRARGVYAAVHSVFIEEEPRIADCYALAQTKDLVMVPFFISDGLHSVEDIPVLLGEPEQVVRERLRSGQPTWRNPTEKRGKRLWYSRSVGSDPLLVEVILDRVRELVGQEASSESP